jgi:hypothetical protein
LAEFVLGDGPLGPHLDQGIPLALDLDKLFGPHRPLSIRALETLLLALDVLPDVAHHHLGIADHVEDQPPDAPLDLFCVVVAGVLARSRTVAALVVSLPDLLGAP